MLSNPGVYSTNNIVGKKYSTQFSLDWQAENCPAFSGVGLSKILKKPGTFMAAPLFVGLDALGLLKGETDVVETFQEAMFSVRFDGKG